jgi:putative transposase
VGDIPLHIPKLRSGPYFPSFLEPRRRAERALLAVREQAYIEGLSTRKVDDLLQAMGLSGIDKSTVSRICQELDAAVTAFRTRPLPGVFAYGWFDALYLNVRQNHRIVSMAVVIAIGVRESGERTILDLDSGASEDSAFWTSFLRRLVERGLQGVELAISDAHLGLQDGGPNRADRCDVAALSGTYDAQHLGTGAATRQEHGRGCDPDHLCSADPSRSQTPTGTPATDP